MLGKCFNEWRLTYSCSLSGRGPGPGHSIGIVLFKLHRAVTIHMLLLCAISIFFNIGRSKYKLFTAIYLSLYPYSAWHTTNGISVTMIFWNIMLGGFRLRICKQSFTDIHHCHHFGNNEAFAYYVKLQK